jgi:uncharacterized protein (TIGR02646 family)
MRRIARTPAPADLAGCRTAGLAAVRALGRPPTRKEIPDTYRSAAHELWRMQHMRCCYCEVFVHREYNDVEHYRPCSLYWWLAWDWSNLLFACPRCNRKHKNDSFELESGSRRLVAEEQPPGDERPLLLDPSTTDPREHIRYVLAAGKWIPTGRTPAGTHTIELLVLDSDPLVEHMTRYYESTIADAIHHLVRCVRDPRAPLEPEWQRTIARLTAPGAEFVGLAEDALAAQFPSYPRPPR